ncbi:uncharacterized protein BT62DRAFT_1007454 [Guyanagaster necrorhizus]|uniref:Uncharacterized protein n=1 Tax=Guyanagaster necrorhizus TaxID=856835 RepID=A0A9P7VRE3_9AGAR|nr:uncharacterized protein BT62DRAFT_1007454 [Guyanagaster necrorhizus MCA 3950]KAG7445080.1 hypothetical protein BT62DRAFT_1007454 [Guyanagaster necrorhizus MCA 3950]
MSEILILIEESRGEISPKNTLIPGSKCRLLKGSNGNNVVLKEISKTCAPHLVIRYRSVSDEVSTNNKQLFQILCSRRGCTAGVVAVGTRMLRPGREKDDRAGFLFSSRSPQLSERRPNEIETAYLLESIKTSSSWWGTGLFLKTILSNLQPLLKVFDLRGSGDVSRKTRRMPQDDELVE